MTTHEVDPHPFGLDDLAYVAGVDRETLRSWGQHADLPQPQQDRPRGQHRYGITDLFHVAVLAEVLPFALLKRAGEIGRFAAPHMNTGDHAGFLVVPKSGPASIVPTRDAVAAVLAEQTALAVVDLDAVRSRVVRMFKAELRGIPLPDADHWARCAAAEAEITDDADGER